MKQMRQNNEEQDYRRRWKWVQEPGGETENEKGSIEGGCEEIKENKGMEMSRDEGRCSVNLSLRQPLVLSAAWYLTDGGTNITHLLLRHICSTSYCVCVCVIKDLDNYHKNINNGDKLRRNLGWNQPIRIQQRAEVIDVWCRNRTERNTQVDV